MSDPSENEIIQQSKEEYVPEIDPTNYFQLQDEKFEELHRKLHKLKEENKKQIDAIINNLDDLMASKCVIEQTLDKITPDDLPIELSNEKLNIVDLLSKVTGVVSDSNLSSLSLNHNKEFESADDPNVDCSGEKPEKSHCDNESEKDKIDHSSEESKQIETTADGPSVNSEN